MFKLVKRTLGYKLGLDVLFAYLEKSRKMLLMFMMNHLIALWPFIGGGGGPEIGGSVVRAS